MTVKDIKKSRRRAIKYRYRFLKRLIWKGIKSTIKTDYLRTYYSQHMGDDGIFIFRLLKRYFEKKGFRVVIGKCFMDIYWG